MKTHWKLEQLSTNWNDYQTMFLRKRADYGAHFYFDTTSGKTDGKLLMGMKNYFDTAEFSS